MYKRQVQAGFHHGVEVLFRTRSIFYTSVGAVRTFSVSYTHLKQFGKAIIEFPAVYDMLAIMKGKLDAGRALLYPPARYVDIYKALDDIARARKLTPAERRCV